MRLRFFRRSSFRAAGRRVVCILAALTLPAWLPPAARADIQNPGRSTFKGDRDNDRRGDRPATGVAQTVSVLEGGTVMVLLRSRGHANEMVDFLLRTLPAHGTLDGDPHQVTLSGATVSYTHRPGDNATEDSFTYAVQTRGGPVSADTRVTVRIQEPPPVLAVSPPELDFGAVKAGQTTRAEVTLTNQGGGQAVGRVEPPAPWVVDGPAEYRLGRGASRTFGVIFKPQLERSYVDALHFRDETGSGVRLVGTGLAGPGQTAAAGGRNGAGASLAGQPAFPAPAGGNGGADAGASLPPPAAASPPAGAPGAGASVPAGSPGITSLEPTYPGGMPSLPSAAAISGAADDGGVTSFAVRSRGRNTLELGWRALVPPPKSYRVELRYLSLDRDDKLIVDWRPYAQVDFETAHGYVTARLSGLPAESQESLRIVAVDPTGRLTTPSPLLVTYTLPASTWWRPTPLKVLFLLLFICGGMVLRQRWETNQILREIDDSRRRAAMT